MKHTGIHTPTPESISHVARSHNRKGDTSSTTYGAAMVSNIPTTTRTASKLGANPRSNSQLPTATVTRSHADADSAVRHDELLPTKCKRGTGTRCDEDPQAVTSGPPTPTALADHNLARHTQDPAVPQRGQHAAADINSFSLKARHFNLILFRYSYS